jgi:hypothetical protein
MIALKERRLWEWPGELIWKFLGFQLKTSPYWLVPHKVQCLLHWLSSSWGLPPFFSRLTCCFYRAVRTIKPTTVSSSPKKASHTGAVTGAVTGTVFTLLAVIGVVVFVRRRRRYNRPSSILSSNDLIEAGPQVTVTPFYLAPQPAQQDPAPWMTELQSQSETHPFERMAALDDNSSSSALLHPLPSSLPIIPAPVGLSSKELAQLRTEASEHSRTNNAGLTSGPHPDPSPTATTGQSSAISSPDPRRLQSEVENLRHEMQLLRAERFEALAPPPSYTEEERR